MILINSVLYLLSAYNLIQGCVALNSGAYGAGLMYIAAAVIVFACAEL